MSVGHARNVCKSQNTCMPVFFCFWPSYMLHVACYTLQVNHWAPIRTIADNCQSSFVCPLINTLYMTILWLTDTFSILWLTDPFSILGLTDTFCIVFYDLKTYLILFLFFDLQTHLENWKSGATAKYLWVIRLLTVDPVWAKYIIRTKLEKNL